MSWINLDAIWKIVVFGLLAGAGLPALFSLGLLALSQGRRPPARARTPTSSWAATRPAWPPPPWPS